MPMFMAQFAYTPQAWAALIHAPQDRAAASDALLRHFGGSLIGLYYTPGAEYAGFALFEAPDDLAAAAVEIADVAFGHLRSNRLLRVLSPEEMHWLSGRRPRRRTLPRSPPTDGQGWIRDRPERGAQGGRQGAEEEQLELGACASRP